MWFPFRLRVVVPYYTYMFFSIVCRSKMSLHLAGRDPTSFDAPKSLNRPGIERMFGFECVDWCLCRIPNIVSPVHTQSSTHACAHVGNENLVAVKEDGKKKERKRKRVVTSVTWWVVRSSEITATRCPRNLTVVESVLVAAAGQREGCVPGSFASPATWCVC